MAGGKKGISMNISYRLVIITAIFITCLITANTIAVKIISLGPIFLPAAIFVFPLSYIFGDVLTEVYGYQWTRKIIWLGFICNLIFIFFVWVGQLLPPAPFWEGQPAYESILGYAPRLLAASFLGYRLTHATTTPTACLSAQVFTFSGSIRPPNRVL